MKTVFLCICYSVTLVFGQIVNETVKETCPINQAYTCTGACYPRPTCRNRNPISPILTCKGPCILQCDCDSNLGYVRNEQDNTCVKVADCPCSDICPINEAYTCTGACYPIRTCQNRKTESPSLTCKGPCIRQCECDLYQDYIRNEVDNTCVKIKDCPRSGPCPKHEYQGCSPCPCPDPTCQNPNPICNRLCVLKPTCIKECRCVSAYLRDTSTGLCVPKTDCPVLPA